LVQLLVWHLELDLLRGWAAHRARDHKRRVLMRRHRVIEALHDRAIGGVGSSDQEGLTIACRLFRGEVLGAQKSVLALQLEDRLAQSAKLVVLASDQITLAVKLSLEVLHSDLENVFIRFSFDQLRLQVFNLGFCFHTSVFFDRCIKI